MNIFVAQSNMLQFLFLHSPTREFLSLFMNVFIESRISVFIRQCLIPVGLDKLGLFRVSGAEKRITQLEAIFDKGPDYGLGWYHEP
jgi:hypothetical protein